MKVVTNVEGNPAEGYRLVGDIANLYTAMLAHSSE